MLRYKVKAMCLTGEFKETLVPYHEAYALTNCTACHSTGSLRGKGPAGANSQPHHTNYNVRMT